MDVYLSRVELFGTDLKRSQNFPCAGQQFSLLKATGLEIERL
jgi:hypothetical protein